MNLPAPIIQVKNLTKRYGNILALDQMNVDFFSNEITGIVGNNGSGKTTFLRLLLDLMLPDNGRVLFRGENVHRSDHWKPYTGAYVDESFLPGYLTPGEYARIFGRLRGFPEEYTEICMDRIKGFPAFNVLDDNKLIRNLSDGNRQRLGILGAVLFQPELIILDEPFNFLDPASQQDLIRILRDYSGKQETTILLTSHNLQFVSEVCTRIILFESGKIIDDFQNRPDSLLRLKTYFKIEC